MKSTNAVLAIAVLSLSTSLVACSRITGGDGGPSGPSHTLTISPATASTRASGAPVKLAAQGEGLTPAGIVWTLSGPGSLSTATGPSIVYTPPADGAAEVSATVTARDGDLTASAAITVGPLTGATVNGQLLAAPGAPIRDASVMILGNTPTTTDGDGRFVVKGVLTPYDLLFAVPSGPDQATVVQINGLTTLNPVFSADLSGSLGGNGGPPPQHSASISGALTGGVAAPMPADVQTAFAFDGPADSSASGSVADNGNYALDVQWGGVGPASLSAIGTVHALQWNTDANGLPTSFTGHASKGPLQVDDHGTMPGQDLALDPVATDTLTATVSTSGITQIVFGRAYEAHFGTGIVSLGSETAAGFPGLTGPVSYKTPHVSGATIQLTITAVTINGLSQADMGLAMVMRRNLATDATNVAIAMPAAPRQTAPAKGATGVDTTTSFTWTGGAGLKMVQMSSAAGAPQPGGAGASGAASPSTVEYTVITTGSSVTLPDVSLFGIEMPRAADYTWTVATVENITSTDVVASADAAQVINGYETLKLAVSPQGSFTTAP